MYLENSRSTEKSGQRVLLSIVELGGYPDFKSMYKSLGYQVLQATTVRKALALLKKNRPDVKEQAHQLERLTGAYPLISKTLSFPIECDVLKNIIGKNIIGQAVIADE